jgi:hypothetical protein
MKRAGERSLLEEMCRLAGLDGRGEWLSHSRNYVHRHDVPLRSIFGMDRPKGSVFSEERFRFQRAVLHVSLTEYLEHWSRDLTDVVSSFIVPLPSNAPIVRLAGFDAYPADFDFHNVASLDHLLAGTVRYENGRARFSVYAAILGQPTTTISIILHTPDEANELSRLMATMVPLWASTFPRDYKWHKMISVHELHECCEWAQSTTSTPIVCGLVDTLRRNRPTNIGKSGTVVYELTLSLVTIRQIPLPAIHSKIKRPLSFLVRPEFLVDTITPTTVHIV